MQFRVNNFKCKMCLGDAWNTEGCFSRQHSRHCPTLDEAYCSVKTLHRNYCLLLLQFESRRFTTVMSGHHTTACSPKSRQLNTGRWIHSERSLAVALFSRKHEKHILPSVIVSMAVFQTKFRLK